MPYLFKKYFSWAYYLHFSCKINHVLLLLISFTLFLSCQNIKVAHPYLHINTHSLTPPKREAQQRQQVIHKAIYLMHKKKYISHNVEFSYNPLGFVRAAFWQSFIELLPYPQNFKSPLTNTAHNILRNCILKNKFNKAYGQLGDIAFFYLPKQSHSPLNTIEPHIPKTNFIAIVTRYNHATKTYALLGKFKNTTQFFYLHHNSKNTGLEFKKNTREKEIKNTTKKGKTPHKNGYNSVLKAQKKHLSNHVLVGFCNAYNLN